MSTPDSTLGELADLKRRVAGLQTAYEEAQRGEVEMRLAIAELHRSLGVLVPLVDLMRLEAEDRGLPAADLKDLAVFERHLERLCRAAAVAMPAAGPDSDGLFDPNGSRLDS